MLRSLSLVVLMSSSLAVSSHAGINFSVDERGFENCYSSFVSKVRPGALISSQAFENIANALEEKGNVLQKMAARENQRVVLNQNKRKAFMDNVQGKGDGRKRARVDENFFQMPVVEQAAAPANRTQEHKRAWRVRYDAKLVAPVAPLLDRQDAMDIIEEMFTPAPRNILFLANHTQNAHSAKEADARPSLKRQNADVAQYAPAFKKQRLDNTAPAQAAPILDQPDSLVRSRISFWESVAN